MSGGMVYGAHSIKACVVGVRESGVGGEEHMHGPGAAWVKHPTFMSRLRVALMHTEVTIQTFCLRAGQDPDIFQRQETMELCKNPGYSVRVPFCNYLRKWFCGTPWGLVTLFASALYAHSCNRVVVLHTYHPTRIIWTVPKWARWFVLIYVALSHEVVVILMCGALWWPVSAFHRSAGCGLYISSRRSSEG
jgi:hypothetical protein